MCWLGSTSRPGASFGATGSFYIMAPTLAVPLPVDIPSGVNTVDMRPSFALYNGESVSRTYMVGGWTDNLVLTENFTLSRMGIIPPFNPLRNSAGGGIYVGVVASGTGVTGNAICYIRWWDDVNGRRSPLSAGSPTFALANNGRAWSNLPTNPHDPTVTHIEGWVSMDGGLPRFAWRRDLGTTAVTENLATALLGEAELDSLGRFPRCRFNTMWNDRQAMAGDDRHPDRIYLSPIGDPENYGGFFLRTRKGEAVVGLISMRKQLVVLCAESSYVIQGYTEDDIAMDILEPHIGCISHFAVTDVDGWAIVPSHRGLYLCTGSSFHNISLEYEKTWRHDFKVARAQNDAQHFEDAWAVNDIETNSYKLFTQTGSQIPSGQAGYWVLGYSNVLPQEGGAFGQPDLMFDVRHRVDTCASVLKLPGARSGELYVGSEDGVVRQENVDSNNDDDEDEYGKTLLFQGPHAFPNGPGGTEEDASKLLKAWAFVKSETKPYTVRIFAGDESAPQADVSEAWPITVDAGEQVIGNDTYVAKCVEAFEPGIGGRGFSVQVEIETPVSGYDDADKPELNTYIAGFGYEANPGVNQRLIRVTEIPPP